MPKRERRWAMTSMMIVAFMAVLDGTIVNVALPTMARDLNATPAESIWIANAFQIAVTATLFAFASLGGLIGFDRVYSAGAIVFTLGSLFCSLSHRLDLLIVARAIQGIGASMLMGIQPALIRSIYPPERLGRGTGAMAVMVATTAAAGPTIGGAILAVATWPWLFLINVPVGIADTLLMRRTLPHIEGRGSLRDFDLPGAIFAGLALTMVTLAVEALAHQERRWVWPCVAILVVSLALFIRRQKRIDKPLLPLEAFERAPFTLSSLTSVCSYTAQGLAIVSLPFFFQASLGRSPLEAALLLTPWPISVALVARWAGRLADRVPVAILGTAGLSVMALGAAALALLPSRPGVGDIVWREMLCGLGFGFFQSPNNREIMSSLPHALTSVAAGMLATARVFGQSLGAALVAVVFGVLGAQTVALGGEHFGAVRTAMPITLWAACVIAALGAAVSSLRYRNS
ncbi:MAG: MFS transporter [Candidatus Eremiobacteraeota bacterium]|nr:MFS transporter [Candidatus Eremiobacteraeota bacterium]